MNPVRLACASALLVLMPALFVPPLLRAEVTRYDNGRWLVGSGFVEATYYVIDGVLETDHSGEVDRVVNLEGRWVVPPLGDAHTHALADARFAETQQRFFSAGVFYAANPNSLGNQTAAVRDEASRPETVDVTYANGGLTSSGGHPIQIYDRAADHTPGVERHEMAGQAYWVIDDLDDLEEKWPLILAGQPDFLKIYLEESEHHAARKDDDKFYGRRGLDPALVAPLVERAHRAGLRVAVHVSSLFDFLTAVEAGADEIAHLPLAPLDEAAARLAKERSTTVVTTTTSHRPSSVENLQELHRQNLRLLENEGVRIVLGTDSDQGLLAEMRNVSDLMQLSNAKALEMATRTTPQWIFPDRKIGSLASGAEASFLVLDADPLADLSALEQIHLRVKNGHTLEVDLPEQKPSIGQALVHTIMSSGVEDAIEEYHRLRSESPDDYDFSEPQLDALGYALIQHGQLDAAVAIFELNAEMFPEAFNVYDSLGEGLMLAGRKEEAIRNFRRSLELNPNNENARERLGELGEL